MATSNSGLSWSLQLCDPRGRRPVSLPMSISEDPVNKREEESLDRPLRAPPDELMHPTFTGSEKNDGLSP